MSKDREGGSIRIGDCTIDTWPAAVASIAKSVTAWVFIFSICYMLSSVVSSINESDRMRLQELVLKVPQP